MLRSCAVGVIFLVGLAFSSEAQKLRPPSEEQPGLSSTEGLPREGQFRGRKARQARRKAKATAQDNYYTSRSHKAQKHRQQIIEDDKEKKPHPDSFGHRGRVQRRPSGRLKYCKTCGIRH